MDKTKKAKLLVSLALLVTALAVVAMVVILTLESFGVIGKKTKVKNKLTIDLQTATVLEQGKAELNKLTVTNGYKSSKTLLVRIAGQNISLSPVSESDTAIGQLTQNQVKSSFGDEWANQQGLTWRPNTLQPGKSASAQIVGLPVIDSDKAGAINVKVYELKETSRRCGFLWFKKCDIRISENLLNQTQKSIPLESKARNSNAMLLNKGFNLITLPVISNDAYYASFWEQFTQPLAWHLGGGVWLDVTQKANYQYLVPGKAIWLYHPDGGEVQLPKGSAVSSEGEYDTKLSQGWNQVGNPYQSRIKLDGEQIIVKRQGKETLTLSGAMASGVITKILSYGTGQSSGDTVSEASYIDVVPGRFIPESSGLFIYSSEEVTLAWPGRKIFAPGELISSSEKSKIIAWINRNNLDVCGNEPTSNIQNNPLWDSATGAVLDQFDCILLQHPDQPWNK